MFKPLGLLSSIQCPTEFGSNPIQCKDSRSHCPFLHRQESSHSSSSSSSTSTSAQTSASINIKGSNEAVSSDLSHPHSPPAESIQPILKKARNAYQPSESQSSASTSTSTSPPVSSTTTPVTIPKVPQNGSAPVKSEKGTNQQKSRKEDQTTFISSTGQPIPPQLTFATHPAASSITLSSRQASLKSFHSTFSTIYQPLLATSNPRVLKNLAAKLLHDTSLEQELEVFKTSNKFSYKNACVTILVGIKKRDLNLIQEVARKIIRIVRDAGGSNPKSETGNETENPDPNPNLSKSERLLLEIKTLIHSCPEIGTQSQVISKRNFLQERKKNQLTKERLIKVGFLCPENDLEKWDFVTEKTLADLEKRAVSEGTRKPDCEGEIKTCERCDREFKVGVENSECNYHWGKRVFEKLPSFSSKVQVWTCCSRPVDSGSSLGLTTCSIGSHVFKVTDPLTLHLQESFIKHSNSEIEGDSVSDGDAKATSSPKGKGKAKAKDRREELDIAAIDCELSYTTQGLSLTRVTVLNEIGDVVYDSLVRPKAKILDFNTRFSGVNAKDFQEQIDTMPDLAEARKRVMSFVGKDTILIGHGLENDLRALRMIHNRVVDTTMLFPHARGLPFRQSLKYLTSKHLGKIIQTTSSTEGHSSAEDARMALELVRWKYINEPQSPFSSMAGSGSSTTSRNLLWKSPSSSSLSSDNQSNGSGQHHLSPGTPSGPSRTSLPNNPPNKPLNFFGSPQSTPKGIKQEVPPSPKLKSKTASAFIPSQPRRTSQLLNRPPDSSPKNLPTNPFVMNGASSSDTAMQQDGKGGWTDEMERTMRQRIENERKIKEGMELMPLGNKKK